MHIVRLISASVMQGLCAASRSDAQRAGRPRAVALLSLVALLIAGATSCRATAAGAPSPPPQDYTLYRFDPLGEGELVPLDPQTLEDRADKERLEPGSFAIGGATRVDVEYPPGRSLGNPGPHLDQIWIVTRDLGTGAVRGRFNPPANGLVPFVSEDGERLAFKPHSPGIYEPSAEWYVLDTTTGETLAHVKDPGIACFRGGRGLFDPALQERVYCPVEPDLRDAEGPAPLRVVAYDLESGEKAGEVALPEALIGGWRTGRTVEDLPVWAFLEPAVVLSPDGGQLAVVHAGAEAVTLVDAGRLAVERTLGLHHAQSLLDWFAPAVAQAKGLSDGTVREAVFSLDGAQLYVFGQDFSAAMDEPAGARGLGLVDLAQGEIVAEALPDSQIQWAQPAPDGTLYVFGTTDQDLGPHEIRATSPSTLWRLDARTLEVLAQREFSGYQGGQLVLEGPAQ
jgi:hypothetical protein